MQTLLRSILLIPLLSLGLTSCGEKARIRENMVRFMKSEIVIPDDLECINNRDITPICKEIFMPNKFIIYYDSLDCSSCRISHLVDIYPIYEMADTINFTVITIFSPSCENMEEVIEQLMMLNHPIPIYVDTQKSFSRINEKIPSDYRFHNFLIDNNNRVIYVGNPLTNTQMSKLFIQTILQ